MRNASDIGIFYVCAVIAAMLLCSKQPADPAAEDPDSVKVELFIDDASRTVKRGVPLRIGVAISCPAHVDSIHLTAPCADLDTMVCPDPTKAADTLSFNTVFAREGSCMIRASVMLYEKQPGNATDSLLIQVLPALTFIAVPAGFATHLGRTDTLRFVASTGNDTSTIRYSFTSEPPLDSEHLYPTVSATGDVRQCVFDPDTADSFTLIVHASSGSLLDSAVVGIRVYATIAFAGIDVPRSVVTGDTDTLVFTIDRKNRPDSLWIELINAPAFDTATVKVLRAGIDSLLIALSPDSGGTLPVVVRITNGAASDTSWFMINAVDSAYAVWNNSSTNIEAFEGIPLEIDLRQYLFSPAAGELTFSIDSGMVTYDTLWKWTPPWGCDSAFTVTLRAESVGGVYLFHLNLSIQPGDTTAPRLRLVDTSLIGKTIVIPRIAIEAVVKDTGAGVEKVTFSTGSKTIDAEVRSDSIYTALIDSLASGMYTPITIIACDRSMRRNSTELKFYLTYDSTIKDTEPPAIVQIDGTKKGGRATSSGGRMAFRITDVSGIDSAWWTLNGSDEGILTKQSDSGYSFWYELTEFGGNRIVVHARDGSPDHPRDSLEVTLVYNTTPDRVHLTSPEDEATGVDTVPAFAWSGGKDKDGDPVYFRVRYGTSENNLMTQTGDLSDSSLILGTASGLAAATKYYWQVIARSKVFPDTSESSIHSFTTRGAAPKVTLPPASVTVTDGDSAVLTVTVTGTPPITYQWLKNGTMIDGATSAVCKIRVSMADSGAKIQCTVSNDFGADSSDDATLTITPKPLFVAFESRGGTSVDTQFVQNGSYAHEPAIAPTKSNFEFGGWFTSSSLLMEFDFSATPITDGQTLYAKWIPVYAVFYDRNGSERGFAPIDSNAYKNGDTVRVFDNIGNLSKAGFSFGGWNIDRDGTGSDRIPGETFIMTSGPVVLYAKWIPLP